MKNLSRHLFLGFAAVCVIALCVFLIQLIIINSGTEPSEPNSVVTVSPGQDEPGEGDPNAPETPDQGYQTPRPPPRGVRMELPVDSDTVLIIYEDSENFSHSANEFDWRFDYKGGGNASLTISFVFLSPQGVAADAEGFLNAYIEGDTAEYKGVQPIIDSPLTGYSVAAQKDGVSYEAWLYRLPDSDRNLALAFLINYEFNSQQDALYELLSSIDIGSATGGNTTDGSAAGGSPTDGSATGGNTTDGSPTGGNTTDGNATGGSPTDGSATGGNTTDGSATGGNTTDGNATGE